MFWIEYLHLSSIAESFINRYAKIRILKMGWKTIVPENLLHYPLMYGIETFFSKEGWLQVAHKKIQISTEILAMDQQKPRELTIGRNSSNSFSDQLSEKEIHDIDIKRTLKAMDN